MLRSGHRPVQVLTLNSPSERGPLLPSRRAGLTEWPAATFSSGKHHGPQATQGTPED